MKTAPSSVAQLTLYARQWGATAIPFDEPGWLETPSIQRVDQLLEQTAALRGVMLLTGAHGVGKSAVVSRWLGQLDQRLYYATVLTQATLSGSSLLAALASQLGKPPTIRRERNLEKIQQALGELERRSWIVVLDEAQNYTHPAMEELRLLLGLNFKDRPAFGLILLGNDYLLGTLRLRPYRALYSRISCAIQLGPWQAEQIAQYLQQGFQAVGLNRSALEPAAVELLTAASGGLPRSLCLLARAAWIEASRQNQQLITADHVQAAMDQVPYKPGLNQPALSQPVD